MKGGSEFTVTNPRAPREITSAPMRALAGSIAAAASGGAPVQTGQLRGGFSVTPGNAPGAWLITISVPHFRYQEWGTRHIRPAAMLGRAVAAARASSGAR